MNTEISSLSSDGIKENDEDREDQMIACDLAEDEAIVKVIRKNGSKRLCFTDKKGAKLHVNLSKEDGEIRVHFPHMKAAVPNEEASADIGSRSSATSYHCSCGYICDTIYGHKVCVNPANGEVCTRC